MSVLITGATDGLGKAVATELARDGATLLLHGRDAQRGERTLEEIRRQTGNERLSFYRADFASLAQVRALAEQLRDEHDQLSVLVNNAGIGTTLPGDGERIESEDGYELRFQVNYLAGFLLTELLKPLLVGPAPARIVDVSSAGQQAIDFDDVMLERAYDPVRAYRQSKLAQVMHTFDLAEQLRGQGVTANCLHPATFMPTKMVLHARAHPISSVEDGVRATRRLIDDPGLQDVTGRYFNGTTEARAESQAYDADARRRLRGISMQLVDLGAA